MKYCSFDGCIRKHHASGFCGLHHYRWNRYGDPAYLSPKYTEKGMPLAWIDEHRNYSGDECLIWPFARTQKGYGTVKIDRRTTSVHRIMCEALNGPAPENMQAAHSCGQGFAGCVNPRHLRWATAAENTDDKIRHGTVFPSRWRGRRAA